MIQDGSGLAGASRMKGTYTPGPWGPMMDGPKIDRMPWEPWAAFMEAAPGLTIGSTQHTEPICRVSGYLHDVEANARLIAAAPDLLEAAYECFATLEQSRAHNCAGWDCATCRPSVMRERLLEVIAKATGEQP